MTLVSPFSVISRLRVLLILAVIAISTLGTATAGTAAQELTQCMVNKTSPAERFDTALVTWVSASYHPSMPVEFRVPVQSKELIFRRVGKMLDRLLLVDCKDNARAAVRSEGQSGFAGALFAFWASGTAELNQSKEATSAFSEIWGYTDGKKISAALRGISEVDIERGQ